MWPTSSMPTNLLKKQVRKVRALVEASGSPWRPVEACGSLWQPVEACGSLWKSVEACGSLWKSVEIYGSLWKPVINSLLYQDPPHSFRFRFPTNRIDRSE